MEGKSKYLIMDNPRAKWGAILDSRALVEHIWDNVDLVMFKAILGLFGALAIVLETQFFTSILLLNL